MLRSCHRQIRVKAVEIDAARAAAAGELLGAHNVLHSPIENISAVGKFNILWLNPPYYQLPGGRAELAWVKMCAPMWTVTRRTNGNGNGPGYARYPLARYIRDHYRDRYVRMCR